MYGATRRCSGLWLCRAPIVPRRFYANRHCGGSGVAPRYAAAVRRPPRDSPSLPLAWCSVLLARASQVASHPCQRSTPRVSASFGFGVVRLCHCGCLTPLCHSLPAPPRPRVPPAAPFSRASLRCRGGTAPCLRSRRLCGRSAPTTTNKGISRPCRHYTVRNIMLFVAVCPAVNHTTRLAAFLIDKVLSCGFGMVFCQTPPRPAIFAACARSPNNFGVFALGAWCRAQIWLASRF